MVPVPLSGLQPSRDEAIEEWPWLDEIAAAAGRRIFTASGAGRRKWREQRDPEAAAAVPP